MFWSKTILPAWVRYGQAKLNSELLPAEGKVFAKKERACIKLHATCFFWQSLHVMKQV